MEAISSSPFFLHLYFLTIAISCCGKEVTQMVNIFTLFKDMLHSRKETEALIRKSEEISNKTDKLIAQAEKDFDELNEILSRDEARVQSNINQLIREFKEGS